MTWALLCASLLWITLATSLVVADETIEVKNGIMHVNGVALSYEEEQLKRAELKAEHLCEGAVEDGAVETMDECLTNLQNGLNPDGTRKGINCRDSFFPK